MASDNAMPRLSVKVLGPLEFDPVTPELAALNGQARKVLCLLVTAWPKSMTAKAMSSHLRADRPLDPSAIHKFLKQLKDAGIRIRQAASRPEQYSLDPDQVTVDAWTLQQEIRDAASPEAVDRLARLWRGDPQESHEISSWRWAKVHRARDMLVRLIEGLPGTDRPADPVLWRLAPHLVDSSMQPGPAARRPRILVVDDIHAATVANQAMADPRIECDCDQIESIEEWMDLRDIVDVGSYYQAALIDLHLDRDSAFDDKLGLKIVDWLGAHTEIPVAVVSSDPGTGLDRERARQRAEHRLVAIVDKGRKNRYLNEIPEVVRLLLSNDDDCRQARLETWLLHARRRLQWAHFEGRISADEFAAAEEEFREAEIALRYERVDHAENLVQAYYQKWRPRGSSSR
ncbi:hypothetical protein [Dactylosporangium salmoneum]|uniref:Response regulator n=1 Tax=Dactylosporangium salmoneum TaxID=53361 RepID=A0ABN3GHY5_9ACTN